MFINRKVLTSLLQISFPNFRKNGSTDQPENFRKPLNSHRQESSVEWQIEIFLYNFKIRIEIIWDWQITQNN